MATTTTTTATKAPTTLKAASSQPATGVGSLAETNRLLSQAATKTSTSTSSGKDTLPAGIAYQTYNPDGSVRSSQTFAQKSASDKAAVANGTDTAPGIGGELTNQVVPSSAPINTAQPSPSTVNATPYTNPVSDAQAQQNLAQRGLTGGDLAVAQNSLSAAQQGHAAATAGNVPVPQDAGTGVSAATTAMANASTNYVSPAPVVQAYSDATKKLTDDYNQSMSSEGQGKSLVDQYKQFTKDLGIPQLNTELMNMKNIIDGTEDDIRNEVTKAGGFATDSQVLAMTNARNKTMIQNYNNLLQTRSDAMQQVQTMVGLAGQDREYLSKQIDRQLNFDQQQVTFAEKALTNAQSSIQKSIDTYGAASVYKQALATGDPTAVARLNATMGPGFDLKTAATKPTLDEQVKMANIAQSNAAIRASDSTVAKNNADIAATKDAKVNAVKTAASKADNTLTAVTTALKQVSPLSSGTIGGYSTLIPGSPSKNLESTIKTVQSALALDQLAALKANSPNGASGLGAASDREGDWLASNVANLDVGQSTEQLKTNLGLVKTHYINYLNSLGYDYDEKTGSVIAP